MSITCVEKVSTRLTLARQLPNQQPVSLRLTIYLYMHSTVNCIYMYWTFGYVCNLFICQPGCLLVFAVILVSTSV